MNIEHRRWITCLTFAALMITASASGVYAGLVYHIAVDTTLIGSQDGFIDLQFNPGIDSLPATVTIQNFVTDGVLAMSSDNLGGASGTLQGHPVLQSLTLMGSTICSNSSHLVIRSRSMLYSLVLP